ncbi:relaxosome protein TraM [Salmonella enterica subsp. enterica serovar Java]|uniref:Relaxosome protein TraM n=1 Tax=Salmonella enterica subsp. enterica serovar Java TaxID=224729 RepID=A0A5X0ZGE1_SALEB|nr:relaxosome protein TraM [Salmonella enterica]EBY8645318.1 relaxosome protein TraM [Salmonella enterica subsp. enterica serovar Java]EFU2048187.1 relaxosome protein TraM [Salmonella enterica subsp. enterica serovar Java]
MARIQVYVSDEVVGKINAIMDKRRSEGAKNKDISISNISLMLLELGLRVHEVQMERKASGFNQEEFNKTLLENVLKTQMAIAKILGISSLSPHVKGIDKFDYGNMVEIIKRNVNEELDRIFCNYD